MQNVHSGLFFLTQKFLDAIILPDVQIDAKKGGMNMRKALAAVFFAGLFLLMLSTLVVTPDDASAAAIPPPSPADFHAVLAPPAPQPVCSADASSIAESRSMAVLYVMPDSHAVSPAVIHDSNGRVLTSVRYENSVYQVFRAGVAGG